MTRYIADAGKMKEIEKYTIDNIGIPSLVLMERAALCVTQCIQKRFSKKDRVCVVCGPGNNGADGAAIARQLSEDNYKVDVVITQNADKFSDEMKKQTDILKKLCVPIFDKIPDKDYACFVDAIFGIGLTRDISDERILEAIDTINLSDAYIYSVDIPTGIHTDTGLVMGRAVKASETITFTCEKIGLCLYPGKEYAGLVTGKNIGIFHDTIKTIGTNHIGFEKNVGASVLKRDASGNKGTFGKVAVIAGNGEITGAALLCAKAALKSGAGMVKVLSNDKTLDVIRRNLPEAMVQSIDNEEQLAKNIKMAVDWADSVVIGPGIGSDKTAYLKMQNVLTDFPDSKKLVIDADGINLVAKHPELKEVTNRVNSVIYTPHMLELSRLTGMEMSVLKENLDKVMMGIIKDNEAVFVCKDSVTRVYKKDRPVFINRFGNSGMATAGSGDVLAGVIGAIVARGGADLYESSALGVHLHSLAGDLAANDCGENSLMAGDIIDALPVIFKNMEEFN